MPLVGGHEVIAAWTSRNLVASAFDTANIETTMGIVQAIERVDRAEPIAEPGVTAVGAALGEDG